MDTSPQEQTGAPPSHTATGFLASEKCRRAFPFFVPWLLGWVVALFQVLAGYETPGLKVSQLGSLPPFLMLGLALDGQWLSLAIAIVGSIAAAGWLMFAKRQVPDLSALSEVGARAAQWVRSRQSSEPIAAAGEVAAVFDLPSGRQAGLWQLTGGLLLFVFGVVLSFWVYARSLVSRALISMGAQSAPPEISGLILGSAGFFGLIVVAVLAVAGGVFLAFQAAKKI